MCIVLQLEREHSCQKEELRQLQVDKLDVVTATMATPILRARRDSEDGCDQVGGLCTVFVADGTR